MAKFKIGDHVKLLPYPYGKTYGHAGETARVMEGYARCPGLKLDKPCTLHEKGKCSATFWGESRLELVEPETDIANQELLDLICKELTELADREESDAIIMARDYILSKFSPKKK